MSDDVNQLLDRLLGKRRTAVVAVAYLAFVTFAHDLMQQPAYWAQAKLSHRGWNNLVATCAVAALVLIGIAVFRRLARHSAPRPAVVCLLVPVALAVVSFHTLTIMNIEVIHFPQYAILAILVYPLTRRYLDVVLLTTLGGMIDEGYQFFVLHGNWGIYYDFNDVLMNTIGAGFGVAFLYFLDPKCGLGITSRHHRSLFSRYAIPLVAVILLAVCVLLTAIGVIAVNPPADPDAWAIVLRRTGTLVGDWIHTEWGKTYHILLPWEWLAVTVPYVLFYAALDWRCAHSDVVDAGES